MFKEVEKMSKNNYTTYLNFLFILIIVFFVHASYTLATCNCHFLCEEFKCYTGECTQEDLDDTDCMNFNETSGANQNASECPACPACFVANSACVDVDEEFIYSDECEEYFQSLINLPIVVKVFQDTFLILMNDFYQTLVLL